jgi:hypothetical protein
MDGGSALNQSRPRVARIAALAGLLLLPRAPALAQTSTEPLRLDAKIPLGPVHGRIDHMAIDVAGERQFVAELGNDITLSDDLVERGILIRLDAEMVNASERTFTFDPISIVRKDRGKYLAAIFKIIKAYAAADYPEPEQKPKHVAGFDRWELLTQRALMWLDQEDPRGLMDTLRAADPKAGNIVQLLRTFADAFLLKAEREAITVMKCSAKADETAGQYQHGQPQFRYKELRELMSKDGKLNPTAFGKSLNECKDKIRDLSYDKDNPDEWRFRLSVKRLNNSAAYILEHKVDGRWIVDERLAAGSELGRAL